jgi:hypothetical protein
LSHQTRSRKHTYVDVKNDRGDSNIDYIINAKIALLKFREVYVNASLHQTVFRKIEDQPYHGDAEKKGVSHIPISRLAFSKPRLSGEASFPIA